MKKKSIFSCHSLLKRQDRDKSLVGTLSLREKRNGSKFVKDLINYQRFSRTSAGFISVLSTLN